MQRKCKTCGTPTPLAYADPQRKEKWIASYCAVHHAQIERDWLKWCASNGRSVLPAEYRHLDNRDFDARPPESPRVATEQPRSASRGKIRPTAPNAKQGALF